MRRPSPAPPKEIAGPTERVREALRAHRGKLPTLFTLIQQKNPKTAITLRWLRAFSDRKDREPHFSRVVELGAALGVVVEITTTDGEPLLPRKARVA